MPHSQYYIDSYQPHLHGETLLYISLSSYDNSWLSALHSHSFSELFYVIQGQGTFRTEHASQEITTHSLILINPNIRHAEFSSKSKPLKYIVIGIDNLAFDFSEGPQQDFMFLDFSKSPDHFLPILQSMLREEIHQDIFHEEICQHYLSILLLSLYRQTRLQPVFQKAAPSECISVKTYMDSNYAQEISLNTLAQIAHLNKYYLAHIFTETYGIAPINYLLERRILHCKELLRTTDLSITQIARQTGFSSANYLSQIFKKVNGVSPKEYRRRKSTAC